MPDENQKEKLDARLKAMEGKATALEEQAGYAEKEAEIRKRIAEAKSRIATTRQRSIYLPHIPGGAIRFPVILLAIIIVSLLMAKMC